MFAGLAAQLDLDLTVLYCDAKLKTDDFPFSTEYVAAQNVMGLHLQSTLKQAVKKFDVVVIMFNVRYVDMMLLLYDWKLRRNTTLVLWGHGFGKRSWLNRLRLQIMQRGDGIILYYEEQVEKFVKLGLPREKLFFAQNTIDITNYGFDAAAKRNNFLFVGRLHQRKKVEDLIKAFSDLANRHTKVFLEIVGAGEDGVELQKIAEDLGIRERVIFHGEIHDHERLKSIFSNAIAYVSPGAIGLGALHAFAYGCPVVTYKENSNHGPEFINLKSEVNAILTESSIDSLREAMELLLSNHKFAAELQQGAFDFYVKHRTMKNMINQTATAIRSIWQNRKLRK